MPATPTKPLEMDDLLAMSGTQLRLIMDRAHPIDVDSLVDRQFTGTDLSLPKIGQKILWQTFRKAFVRDEEHGDVRGWNVKMEQRGIHGAQVPLRKKNGSPKAFAHYRVRSAEGIRWPKGWEGAHYLDYTVAGNPLLEGLAYTPVVAVNEGSSELILGWEIFNVGGRLIDPRLYWAIKPDGPLDFIAMPVKPPKV